MVSPTPTFVVRRGDAIGCLSHQFIGCISHHHQKLAEPRGLPIRARDTKYSESPDNRERARQIAQRNLRKNRATRLMRDINQNEAKKHAAYRLG